RAARSSEAAAAGLEGGARPGADRDDFTSRQRRHLPRLLDRKPGAALSEAFDLYADGGARRPPGADLRGGRGGDGGGDPERSGDGEDDRGAGRQHGLRAASRSSGRDHEEVRPAAGRWHGRRRSAAMSYCDVAPGHPFHGPYHDSEYGFPLRDDDALFERLVLEINQAGLSWLTILKKREAFSA